MVVSALRAVGPDVAGIGHTVTLETPAVGVAVCSITSPCVYREAAPVAVAIARHWINASSFHHNPVKAVVVIGSAPVVARSPPLPPLSSAVPVIDAYNANVRFVAVALLVYTPRAVTRTTIPCHQVRICGSSPVPPAPSGETVAVVAVTRGVPLAVCHGALGLTREDQYWGTHS
jgi:hypothetical protein